MASKKLIVGGAGAVALALSAARSLHARWRRAETVPDPPEDVSEESLESAPEVSVDEVAELRDELRRELERLANADVKASRSRLSTPPQG